jgi:hypothetical protein
MDNLEQFRQLVTATGAMALLMLIQILVVDVLGICARHVPGTPVDESIAVLVSVVTGQIDCSGSKHG